MRKIKKQNYKSWELYYWAYQNVLAEDYYIPYVNLYSSNIKNDLASINILDVGCGNGGFLNAFKKNFKKSTNVDGIDIKKFSSWNNKPANYNIHNILKDNNNAYSKKYDLVILRDVIEHIELKDKEEFMKIVAGFIKPTGEILATFPPYLSPFGLHQQAIMKSFLKYIPYLSLIPKKILKVVIKYFESEDIWLKIEEIINSGMSISNFKKILKNTNLKIINDTYFTIRPSHEIRYGLKTIKSPLGHFPLLREFLILGTCFILKNKNSFK